MRAAWYDRTGAAADVLVVGELPDPTRTITASEINFTGGAVVD